MRLSASTGVGHCGHKITEGLLLTYRKALVIASIVQSVKGGEEGSCRRRFDFEGGKEREALYHRRPQHGCREKKRHL